MSIELRSSYEYRKILIAGGMKPEDAEKSFLLWIKSVTNGICQKLLWMT